MDIAVVGLGSMGKRRIRLLLQYIEQNVKNEKWQIYGVDTREDRRAEAERLYHIVTFKNLNDALPLADAVVVSTSPLVHSGIIHDCLIAKKDVFTELNLVPDGYEENMKLARENGNVLFLSSTFLYRRDIQYVIEAVKREAKPLNYSYHVGQYLPDWHPWEAVTEYFIGQEKTNGCRELFAIELPWLIKAFGKIVDVKVKKSKNTSLAINYPNNYLLLVEHEDVKGRCNKGMLAVDVMSRKAVRNLEVFNENLYISWEGNPQSLRKHDNVSGEDETINLYERVVHQEGYGAFIIENAYYSELEMFIDAAQSRDLDAAGAYSFADDMGTLALIDKIEAADDYS